GGLEEKEGNLAAGRVEEKAKGSDEVVEHEPVVESQRGVGAPVVELPAQRLEAGAQRHLVERSLGGLGLVVAAVVHQAGGQLGGAAPEAAARIGAVVPGKPSRLRVEDELRDVVLAEIVRAVERRNTRQAEPIAGEELPGAA